MSSKEVPRAGLLKAALADRITNAQGAGALRLSVRQFRRLKRRFRQHGARGLLHGLRGRSSNRRLAPPVREQIGVLMTTTYAGFNDVHLTEKLREIHHLVVSRSTVRHIRLALGRPATRRRAAPQHRSRRPRKPALGQLAQLDASPFAWFEDRGPVATLHGVIDDATSTPLALYFRPHEDLHGYVTILDRTCRQYGVPLELYGDRLNVFVRNDPHWTLAEQMQGRQEPTHFGRMLQTLGIGFIRAHSPQAKGRIERLWDTLQDRLTSELRLRGIGTLDAGNAFLPEFLADFTRRFAQPPADPTPAWRPVPRDLADLLSCRYRRTVARDNTVHLGARWVQIPRGPRGRSYGGCQVEVRERLDGLLRVLYHDTLLASQPSPDPAFVLTPRQGPGPARRGPRPGTLRHALEALGRAQLPLRRAAASASVPTAPAVPHARPSEPCPAPAVPRRRNAPTHPWNAPFSRRQRALKATHNTNADTST
ncbi:MAG TPA: ISNCY family transposase [Methylomirabilota bacterium]